MTKDQPEIPRAQSSASHIEKVAEIKRKTVEQHKRFVEAASAAGCDESEEPFDRALRRLAAAPPPKSVQKRKSKKKRARSSTR
jgi:hypothetical protein